MYWYFMHYLVEPCGVWNDYKLFPLPYLVCFLIMFLYRAGAYINNTLQPLQSGIYWLNVFVLIEGYFCLVLGVV